MMGQVQTSRHTVEHLHAFVSTLLYHRHRLSVSQQQLQQQSLLWLADTHKHAQTHSQQVSPTIVVPATDFLSPVGSLGSGRLLLTFSSNYLEISNQVIDNTGSGFTWVGDHVF